MPHRFCAASFKSSWCPRLSDVFDPCTLAQTQIFESLAQQAVCACAVSLVRASTMLRAKVVRCAVVAASGGWRCTPDASGACMWRQGDVDADLFLIKYLLILREQITPFDIDFTVTEKSLDFTTTSEALSSFLSRSSSLFTFSLSNPLLSLFTGSLPSVAESRVDSKRVRREAGRAHRDPRCQRV